MRRLGILCLLAGLRLANGEPWIGRNPTVCCPNSNPQPGVFLPSALPHPGTDTIAYDDDTVASAWCWMADGGAFGVKFISPAESVTLSGALIYFYSGWPVPGDTLASFRVYADDGLNGAPGTQLFAVDSVGITRGAWNFIPVDATIVAGNFYIFYKQIGTNPNCPGLSMDGHMYTPSHRQWQMDYAGNFHEDYKMGDWMIRAVLDWTPPDTNAVSVRFARDMTRDTAPEVDFGILATIKNMGDDALPMGTPVRLRIAGPHGYVFSESTGTVARLPHGATAQTEFSPAWHIPSQQGSYHINVWTDAAGEGWPADDTIVWHLRAARWIEYHILVLRDTLTWMGPERAVKFHPADFGLNYPVGVTIVSAGFCYDSLHPWDDSSFTFKVYGGDGQTLLYQSETLEAIPGSPIPYTVVDLDSTVIIDTGDFYVAVAPVSPTGFPSTRGDSSTSPVGHSYYGSAGAWTLWPSPTCWGEWVIHASVQDGLGIEETPSAGVRTTNDPTMVRGVLFLPKSASPSSNFLMDISGRKVLDLLPGANDVRALAPGVYFIRGPKTEDERPGVVRKVVLTR